LGHGRGGPSFSAVADLSSPSGAPRQLSGWPARSGPRSPCGPRRLRRRTPPSGHSGVAVAAAADPRAGVRPRARERRHPVSGYGRSAGLPSTLQGRSSSFRRRRCVVMRPFAPPRCLRRRVGQRRMRCPGPSAGPGTRSAPQPRPRAAAGRDNGDGEGHHAAVTADRRREGGSASIDMDAMPVKCKSSDAHGRTPRRSGGRFMERAGPPPSCAVCAYGAQQVEAATVACSQAMWPWGTKAPCPVVHQGQPRPIRVPPARPRRCGPAAGLGAARSPPPLPLTPLQPSADAIGDGEYRPSAPMVGQQWSTNLLATPDPTPPWL